MKNVKNLIIILLIVIVIILVVIVSMFRKEIKVDEYENKVNINLNKTLTIVKDKRKFYAISNTVNTYLQEEDSVIKNMTFGEYLTNNQVENLKDKINSLAEDEQYSTKKMYYIEQSFDFSVYYVCGSSSKFNDNVKEEKKIYYIFLLDTKNMTFAIIPCEEILQEKEIYNKLVKYGECEIEKNDNNVIQFNEVSDESMCRRYLADYLSNMLYNPNRAYETLNEEYRNKRFENIDNYKLYIETNKDIIRRVSLQKYKVNHASDYDEYIIIDNNNNYYIFKETAIMQYSLIADCHTIDLKEFTEKYSAGDNILKVGMNIEKIIDALNSKDYSYIYSKLAVSYKDNNFQTLESFIEYAKNIFSEVNSVEYLKINSEGENYLYKVLFKDSFGKSIVKIEKTIIMQLKDNNDFIFSFNLDNDGLVDINPD